MKSSTFRSAVRSGCGRLVSLGVLLCACGAAALEPPPRCAFETFSNATFDEPDGAAAALGNLELLAKGGYDVVLLTLRCRNDLNSPAVRDLARRYYARARELGVRVCQDIDPRIARARFLEEHPEDAQEMLRVVTAPATNGVAETLVVQPSCGDHMTGGTRPYDAIRGEILRAWAIRKLPDGTVRAREIPFDATPVATERIRVRAKGLTADEELAVLARFAFFSCDVFSPHLAAYGRSLLADYRALGASSAFRDEWGFPPSFLPGQEEHRAFWYSRHYAAAYCAATGRDLVEDALLFAFPLEGRSAAERSAAITAYMRLNWERNAAIEQDFYAAVKETFGPDAYVAKHPTWFPVIGWREFLHNGLDWWQATRDFAQTDETTPVPAACGMAKKFGGSVWLNEGYQTNEALYAEFVWRYAAAGGRMVFHQVYPPTLPKYRPMPPLERARARHEDVLRASRRARDMVRLLDRISSAPIDCPVAWVFGHSRVAWDWTDAAYGDWGGPGVYGLWQRGYGVDLYPSTEFAALSVGADGWLRVGAQRYTALVLHNLSAADRAAFAKLTEGKVLKTRVFESGADVADFLDALGGVTRQMPMPAYVDNARQPCGEWVPLLPAPDGVLTLTDGTRARIKATEDAQRGDPIEGTLVLADGSRFEYAARGLFAANGRFVAGADVTRIRGPGVDFSSATPRDVVLARAAEAAVSVDFTKKSGRIRRINGMNGGPQIVGRGDLVEKAAAEYAALAVPNARLHDIPLVTPGLKVCDVPHIFPIYNPKADPKDAANYYFKPTDDYIRNLKACGVESITYRLGTSIEWTHPRTYFARCPKDIDQFAEVCAGIVRHYSKGWADGFDAGKIYWEIWCEPNSNGSGELWDKGKGIETYWPLYTAVAKRIKAEFPDALVGGPSSNCYDLKLAERMADVCKDEGAALDFFSWHQYISTIEPFDGKIRDLREMFDRKGFAKTELHLNEWHWMPACWSDLGDLKSLMRWEDAPDGINGIESAAFALRTLIGLQESAIDMTDYYMAFDYSSWGLYDRKRELRPNYWPLAWFGALARDAVCRVEATAADGEVSVIAGLTADGAKTALVSDFRPTSRDPLVVRLAGVPPDGHVAVTILRADGRPVTESVRLRDGALFLDRMQGSSVYRIETPARRILSPDGRVGVAFRLADGSPKIDVTCGEKPLAALDLGLVLEEPFSGGFAIEDFSLGGADTSWKTAWGDRAVVKDAHRDCTVVLRERGPKARVLKVEMRAYPEGFAFRYVLDGRGRTTVRDEETRVVFAPGTVAWPIYNTEDTYPAEPVDAANLLPAPGTQYLDHYMLPLTVRRPDGVCASLFEAYVRHYPRAKGEAVQGGTKIRLIGDLEGRTRGTATVDLPFEGPWRAIQIGKDAAELVENATLVLNLNPPCAIKDTSYIKPGLCLSDLENCAMNNRDILAAATRERANGIRHFQIDWGWCGTEWTWSAEEIAAYKKGVPDADKKFPGWRKNVVADPRRPAKGYVPYRPNGFFDYGTTVDLDVPKLVKDLSAIGVDLALYMHGRVFEAERDLDGLFALYRQWGLAGLKPGFVRYGDAESTDWNRMLVETAARHDLWLDIHDRHVPDGMQRTYPNLMLCEGGGGEEGNHPVRQDVSLPFARCLVGPFDYTPKLFREDRTHAHSAAMLLVYPGPSAILRGSAVKREWGPELDFVKRLPMTYDETKVLAADIGRHLIVARRKGDVWYVAGICGEAEYDAGFMLDFLGRGRKRRVTIVRDGGVNGAAVAEAKTVEGGDWFPVRMTPSGGFAMIVEE